MQYIIRAFGCNDMLENTYIVVLVCHLPQR